MKKSIILSLMFISATGFATTAKDYINQVPTNLRKEWANKFSPKVFKANPMRARNLGHQEIGNAQQQRDRAKLNALENYFMAVKLQVPTQSKHVDALLRDLRSTPQTRGVSVNGETLIDDDFDFTATDF